MFFNAHKEGRIGYKKLSDADLGWSSRGHQTHIGLFGDILTFLPNHVDTSCMLVHDSMCEIVDCSFDRIQNPDGTFRSPKIKTGGRDTISIVSRIRDIVRNESREIEWFLVWFGLESEDMVFYLYNNQNSNYQQLMKYITQTINVASGRIKIGEDNFIPLIQNLEKIVNNSSIEIIQELETISQIGTGSDNNRMKLYDIQKAQQIFMETGRKGEELIAEYLKKQQYKGYITNFEWSNKNGESGNPYDFTIQSLNQNIIYMDVKSTLYDFSKPIFISNQEISFATIQHNYQIYRTYHLENDDKHLRICSNIKNYLENLNQSFLTFKSDCAGKNATVQSKFGIDPTSQAFTFGNEITL